MRKAGYRVNKYIGFDDRLFILIGIPVLSFFVAIIFCKVTWPSFWEGFLGFYIISLIYTSSYWIFNRKVIIWFRTHIDRLENTIKRNALQGLTVLITGPLVSALVHFCINTVHKLLEIPLIVEQKTFTNFFTTYVMIFMIIAIYEATYFFLRYEEAVRKQEQIRTEHANTQLVNLRNQVNPHFLFNSLNTLMSLIPHDADHAHQYLDKLSKFYRNSVSESSDTLISLKKELGNLGIYFDLIKERFGAGLEVELTVNPGAGEYILPMSLQLLAENAVKHNIVSKGDPLRIRIYKQGGYVHVENNIQRRITETASTGIGLKNIKMRVELISSVPVMVHEGNGLFKVSIPIIEK